MKNVLYKARGVEDSDQWEPSYIEKVKMKNEK